LYWLTAKEEVLIQQTLNSNVSISGYSGRRISARRCGTCKIWTATENTTKLRRSKLADAHEYPDDEEKSFHCSVLLSPRNRLDLSRILEIAEHIYSRGSPEL
jgi:hypothetical protein